jgi:hypothetical protein
MSSPYSFRFCSSSSNICSLTLLGRSAALALSFSCRHGRSNLKPYSENLPRSESQASRPLGQLE